MLKKRIFIVHGWDGSPDEPLLKWLKEKLEKKGHKVIALTMPQASNPKINLWINFLTKEVGVLDENTYFIGHSIGCQAVMRYLDLNLSKKKAGGWVFIAPWFNLNNLKEEELKVIQPWIEEPIDLEKVKTKAKRFVAIFSDNDPYVPITDAEIFKTELDCEVIIERNKGHYTKEDSVVESETVLKEVLRVVK